MLVLPRIFSHAGVKRELKRSYDRLPWEERQLWEDRARTAAAAGGDGGPNAAGPVNTAIVGRAAAAAD